jgi:uncharacterized repeat protein (TIGR03803 family)
MKNACTRIMPLSLLAVAVMLSTMAWATEKQTIVYEFTNKINGSEPSDGLISDGAGNFYGTTSHGGQRGCGTVFELSPNSSGGWSESVLYSFLCGADGANPLGNLIFDTKGNLYGVAQRGDSSVWGTVFELSPASDGNWTKTTLHSFAGAPDGEYPSAGLVLDAAGNLYGTTLYGGSLAGETCAGLGCGTVFELSPSSSGNWNETIIHTFTGFSDGDRPTSNLALDAAGNLYGTTTRGGSYDNGLVFRLSPSSGGWTLNIVYTFTRVNGDGGGPQCGVVFDGAGNLYGTTGYADGGWGTVYELSPTTTSQWQETVLYTFTNGTDGGLPLAPVILDRWGNLYGTTRGSGGPPSAFKLSRSGTGWTFVLLHDLSAATASPLIQDSAGNLYGTTETVGGRYGTGNGTVFELSPVQ